MIHATQATNKIRPMTSLIMILVFGRLAGLFVDFITNNSRHKTNIHPTIARTIIDVINKLLWFIISLSKAKFMKSKLMVQYGSFVSKMETK